MSVVATYQSILTVKETLAATITGGTLPVVTHDALNAGFELTASTNVPVTKVSEFEQVITSGAATINFAALSGTNGVAVDGTGLKVQSVKIKAPATNGAIIALAEGAANGLALFGVAGTFGLRPGQEVLFFFNDLGSDIASGDRTIDLAGTGSTDKLQFEIVMG